MAIPETRNLSYQGANLPQVTEADDGKVLGVVDGKWVIKKDEGGGGGSSLPEVTAADAGKVLAVNAQGEWDKEDAPSGLPDVSSTDNGKILGVASGEWSKMDAPKELPGVTAADNGKVLTAKNGGCVWETPSYPVPGVIAHFVNEEEYDPETGDPTGEYSWSVSPPLSEIEGLIGAGKPVLAYIKDDEFGADTVAALSSIIYEDGVINSFVFSADGVDKVIETGTYTLTIAENGDILTGFVPSRAIIPVSPTDSFALSTALAAFAQSAAATGEYSVYLTSGLPDLWASLRDLSYVREDIFILIGNNLAQILNRSSANNQLTRVAFHVSTVDSGVCYNVDIMLNATEMLIAGFAKSLN